MDNVTHTLLGVTLARTFSRQAARDWALAALWVSIIANNLPDLDFVIPKILGDGKLGYLLQHRGHTHTLILAIPQAGLALLAGLLLTRYRPKGWRSWFSLSALTVLGSLLHIGADFWNDYGVHPFWPWDNRWYYGDFIFIIEPLIWFALLPLVWSVSLTRWGRGSTAILALIMLGLLWFGPFATPGVAGLATAWLGLQTWIHLRSGWSPGARLAIGWSALISILVVFFAASRIAKRQVTEFMSVNARSESLIHVVVTPNPANPLCWRTVVSSRDESWKYRARIGAVSLAPGWFSADRCPLGWGQERTAPLVLSDVPKNAQFTWAGQFEGEWSELKNLYAGSCTARAALRFARTPFWIQGKLPKIIGDLRYDRETGLGFAEFQIEDPERCPRFVPKWETFYTQVE